MYMLAVKKRVEKCVQDALASALAGAIKPKSELLLGHLTREA